LVFNRPGTTQEVFQAIRRVRPRRLYIAADGARPNRIGETEKVQAVRDLLLTGVDWECDVRTLFRDTNLGCKLAVSSAIDWFFTQEEEGIILEDDTVPCDQFFSFCSELLERYRTDSRIAMIAGANFSERASMQKESYFFSRLSQIWGWATWRRAWQLYDRDMASWPDFQSSGAFERLDIDPRIKAYVKPTFDLAAANRIDTWDYQWSYTVLSNKLYVAVPGANLVRNIGFDADATHTHNFNSYPDMKYGSLPTPIVHSESVSQNFEYDLSKVSRKPAGRLTRLKNRIRRILPQN
jgi:hypothetical protein